MAKTQLAQGSNFLERLLFFFMLRKYGILLGICFVILFTLLAMTINPWFIWGCLPFGVILMMSFLYYLLNNAAGGK